MGININYYERKIECHCCKRNFVTYKVRPNRFKVISNDTDFMPIYDGLNPLLYEVAVCPHCGYAHHQTMTRNFGPFMELIKESYIKSLKKPMEICEERSIDDAIASFKLAYLVAKYSMEESVVLGNISLKIAWLYRLKEDKAHELHYLKASRDFFGTSFSKSKDGEEKIQYLVAELSLRLGDIPEAQRGFSRLITGREVSNKYQNLARKRWEDYKYNYSDTNNESRT